MSSPAWSPAKSRAACSSTSASTFFCPPARWTSAGPPTSAITSAGPIDCKILKIDEARRNIVVSRRKLIEDERIDKKTKLLAEIEPGQIRKGIVKNIAEFGAFVDLGGIDGLLHITDMSWGRVNNPHEVVQDRSGARSLHHQRGQGTREDRPGPEAKVARARGKTSPPKYPIGSRHTARWSTSCPTAPSSSSNRASKGWSTSARCAGPSASTIPTSWSRSATRSRCRSSTSTRTSRKSRSASSRSSPTPGTRWPSAIRPARWSKAWSATSPTTAPSSRSRKASTACCTSAT